MDDMKTRKLVMHHHHRSSYSTMVLQGGLRFYRPDGTLRGMWPTGSYVAGYPDGELFQSAAEARMPSCSSQPATSRMRYTSSWDADGKIGQVWGTGRSCSRRRG